MITKFHCDDCGKSVPVRGMEQILTWEKKCADCRVKDITGGLKEKPKPKFKKKVEVFNGSLRREDKKKTKKKALTPKQKSDARDAYNAKWERECYGRKTFEHNNIDYED